MACVGCVDFVAEVFEVYSWNTLQMGSIAAGALPVGAIMLSPPERLLAAKCAAYSWRLPSFTWFLHREIMLVPLCGPWVYGR